MHRGETLLNASVVRRAPSGRYSSTYAGIVKPGGHVDVEASPTRTTSRDVGANLAAALLPVEVTDELGVDDCVAVRVDESVTDDVRVAVTVFDAVDEALAPWVRLRVASAVAEHVGVGLALGGHTGTNAAPRKQPGLTTALATPSRKGVASSNRGRYTPPATEDMTICHRPARDVAYSTYPVPSTRPANA